MTQMMSVPAAVIVLVLAVLTIVIGACGGSSPVVEGRSVSTTPSEERIAFASVLIEPADITPSPDRIQISPQSSTVVAGQKLLFTAVAFDANGRPLENANFRWFVRNLSAGTITPTGLFTAGSIFGAYPDSVLVSAGSGNGIVTAISSVEIVSSAQAETRLLDTVVTYPREITVLAGQIVGLGALGWDNRGRFVPNLQITWSMANTDAGSVDQFGFFTASHLPDEYPDAIQVSAVQNTPQGLRERREFVSVTITDFINRGILHRVVVVPERVVLSPGSKVDFVAHAFDEAGDPVTDISFDWRIVSPTSGRLEDSGRFVAGFEEGHYPDAVEILATQMGSNGPKQVKALVDVTIEPLDASPKLAAAQLVPGVVTLSPEQQIVFSASGISEIGEAVITQSTWEVIDPKVGSITDSGLFTASHEPGTYREAIRVVLTQSRDGEEVVLGSYATVNIHGQLERVEIRPSTVTVQPGQSLLLAVVGYDSNDIVVPLLRFRWSIEDAKAGTIDRSGLFTAGHEMGLYENAIKVAAEVKNRSTDGCGPGTVLSLIGVVAFLSLTIASIMFSEGPQTVFVDDNRDTGSTVPIAPPDPPTPSAVDTGENPSGSSSGSLTVSLSTFSLGSNTVGVMRDGANISLVTGTIRFERDTDGTQIVIFPLTLNEGQELEKLYDPESGILWESTSSNGAGILTLPLERGSIFGALEVRLDSLQRTGQWKQARVLGATISIGPIELITDGSELGTVAVSIPLGEVPPQLLIDIRGVPLGPEIVSGLDQQAKTQNMTVAAVAYVAYAEVGLDSPTGLNQLELGISRVWTENWSGNEIRIARLDDLGNVQILPTATSHETEQVFFQAELTNGFSTFVLVALSGQPISSPDSSLGWAVWVGIGMGGGALAVLMIGFALLMLSSKRVHLR